MIWLRRCGLIGVHPISFERQSLNTPRSPHETGRCHVRSAEVAMDDITVRLADRVDEARKASLWDHELLYAELHRQIDALLDEWERVVCRDEVTSPSRQPRTHV